MASGRAFRPRRRPAGTRSSAGTGSSLPPASRCERRRSRSAAGSGWAPGEVARLRLAACSSCRSRSSTLPLARVERQRALGRRDRAVALAEVAVELDRVGRGARDDRRAGGGSSEADLRAQLLRHHVHRQAAALHRVGLGHHARVHPHGAVEQREHRASSTISPTVAAIMTSMSVMPASWRRRLMARWLAVRWRRRVRMSIADVVEPAAPLLASLGQDARDVYRYRGSSR